MSQIPKLKCPVCKRCYLNISRDDGMFDKAGEAYCPNCGHITKQSLSKIESRTDKP